MSNDRYHAAQDALTALRNARVNQGDAEDSDLAQAFHSLKRYIERADKEAQAVEDANVRTFRVVNLALDSGTIPNNIYDDWDDISEHAHENWRSRYRTHREFFKETA